MRSTLDHEYHVVSSFPEYRVLIGACRKYVYVVSTVLL